MPDDHGVDIEGLRKGVEGLAHAEPFMVVLDGMKALGEHAINVKDAAGRKAIELKDRFLGGGAGAASPTAPEVAKPIAAKPIAVKPLGKSPGFVGPQEFVGPKETKPLTRERGLRRNPSVGARSLSKR